MTGATVDEIRYMERKGFIKPVRKPMKRRSVREYQAEDTKKVELTIKYRRQGFTWDVAFKKAMQELVHPTLL